jgi:hypothetical protein
MCANRRIAFGTDFGFRAVAHARDAHCDTLRTAAKTSCADTCRRAPHHRAR